MLSEMAINRDACEIEYAVRGPIPQRATELEREGRTVIPCNIGNPQALGQKPISFYRQILGLLEDPMRIPRERTLHRLAAREPKLAGLERDDLICEYTLDRSETILAKLRTGMGAYTESKGPRFIREAIARYIDHRDGGGAGGCVPADPENIFLTNGASEGVRHIIEMLIADRRDGIMIPIPQYPIYSATIRKFGGVQVNYYPDEDDDWNLGESALEDAYARARNDGVRVKAIVVINPANPTGAVLDEKSVRRVIEFAKRRELAIIADEVYQDNLYGARFVSFAKALGRTELPLFSLHSTSKGFHGECGHRGGYLEVRNSPRIEGTNVSFVDVLLKLMMVNLCSNTVGQVLTYLMVAPPEEGSPAFGRFIAEKEEILRDLHEKAVMIRKAFEKMDGVRCFGRIGAMYLFPRLEKLPAGTGDFEYCMSLLESTGLCTVNGSGFGQREGTQHLRIAFLPPKDLLLRVLPQWVEFHNRYVR